MAIVAGAPMLTPEEAAAKRADREQEAADAAAAAGGGAGGDGSAADDPGAGGGRSGSAALRPPTELVSKRYTFQGFPIAVEKEAGTTRYWKDAEANTIGQTKMRHDYGFIEGLGEDDEELDCYVGPDESAPDVHIVHQLRSPDFKAHDEMKVFLGFQTPPQRRRPSSPIGTTRAPSEG